MPVRRRRGSRASRRATERGVRCGGAGGKVDLGGGMTIMTPQSAAPIRSRRRTEIHRHHGAIGRTNGNSTHYENAREAGATSVR